MREVFIGFDSAWTDNLRNPGAAAAFGLTAAAAGIFPSSPVGAVQEAERFVEDVVIGADFVLIGVTSVCVRFAICRLSSSGITVKLTNSIAFYSDQLLSVEAGTAAVVELSKLSGCVSILPV